MKSTICDIRPCLTNPFFGVIPGAPALGSASPTFRNFYDLGSQSQFCCRQALGLGLQKQAFSHRIGRTRSSSYISEPSVFSVHPCVVAHTHTHIYIYVSFYRCILHDMYAHVCMCVSRGIQAVSCCVFSPCPCTFIRLEKTSFLLSQRDGTDLKPTSAHPSAAPGMHLSQYLAKSVVFVLRFDPKGGIP